MTLFVTATALFLTLFNNIANWRPLPRWTYVPLNVAVAAALVILARFRGLSWGELGLHRPAFGPGLRWGGIIAGGLAAALALSFFLPGAERFLNDRRVAGLSGAGLAYTTLVRIPFGTALLEEVAFRGVLYGAWLRISPPLAAAVGSSLVFGLWHIVPTLDLLRTNAMAAGIATRWAAVAAGVVLTAVGGLLFVALREWTNGIVGPIVVHAAANSLATLAAYTWQRT